MKQSSVCYYCFKDPIYHDDSNSLCIDHFNEYHPTLKPILTYLQSNDPSQFFQTIQQTIQHPFILNQYLCSTTSPISKIFKQQDDLLEFKKADLKANCPHQPNNNNNHIMPFKTNPNKFILCNDCELFSNLWCCLHCGFVGCGRNQLGIQGNSHMLQHYNTHPQHCLALKLTSLSSTDYDLYCYKCDELLQLPNIHQRIHAIFTTNQFDLNLFLSHQKLEQTLYELELNTNLSLQFQDILGDPFLAISYIGFTNIGNSCYLNATIQALLPGLLAEPTSSSSSSFNTIPGRIQHIIQYQQDPYYLQPISSNDTTMHGLNIIHLKQLIAQQHPQFNNMHQQDAHELLLHVIEDVLFLNNATQHQLFESTAESTTLINSCYIPLHVSSNTSGSDLLKIWRHHWQTTTTTTFHTWPSLLILQVNKYDKDHQKLDVSITTPLMIDVAEFVNQQPLDTLRINYSVDKKEKGVDEAQIQILQQMGIERDMAMKGLKQHKGDVALAIQWIFANPAEPSSVTQLMEMGFSKNQALRALELSQGNMETALMLLLEGNISDEAIQETTTTTTAKETTVVMPVDSKKSTKYQLKSFISHKGNSTHTGHYVCHRWHEEEGGWILMNDRHVVKDLEADVGKAYLLFYYNMDMKTV